MAPRTTMPLLSFIHRQLELRRQRLHARLRDVAVSLGCASHRGPSGVHQHLAALKLLTSHKARQRDRGIRDPLGTAPRRQAGRASATRNSALRKLPEKNAPYTYVVAIPMWWPDGCFTIVRDRLGIV
jgi:hypothetical protein